MSKNGECSLHHRTTFLVFSNIMLNSYTPFHIFDKGNGQHMIITKGTTRIIIEQRSLKLFDGFWGVQSRPLQKFFFGCPLCTLPILIQLLEHFSL